MPLNAISEYLRQIAKHLASGRATEHTYRAALATLIESFENGITATNEPKHVKCGAPDFIVTRGQTPLGYLEAKDVGRNLDEIERTDQMHRYLEGLSNLILTDYLEFRWYEDGEYRMSARLAGVGAKGKLRKEKDGHEGVAKLIGAFLNARIPTIGGPKELAGRMAALAQLMRDIILRAFDDEDKGGSLHDQLEGFRKVLLHDLEPPQFADMYAQTICYGLFAARCNHQSSEPFTRKLASYDIPKTNPFLRKMFGYVAGPDLDDRVVWAVDHLAELLNRVDIAAILEDFGKRTRQEDPVVHFYETFLTAYDPKMRKARGVYYTPEPVVSYIVRSVDHILKTDFGLPDGLADTTKIPLYETVRAKNGKTQRKKKGESHKVLILDPAVGTGTFLHGVIDHVHEHVQSKGQAGTWSGYVSKHLLPRLFGFELLMAPYAVAHMKLGLQLAETGYDFKSGERLGIYLTNTLEEAFEFGELSLFASLIAAEANAAGRVKSQAPVMVVLGNPPYSGLSMNKNEWTEKLLKHKLPGNNGAQGYYEVDGQPLGEKKVWLQDDYVKFMRFAQYRIERTGHGILAFISNHAYLDNPTFRGMRQSLLRTFDAVWVLNLHGNAKKKEVCPDGTKDENVFDIQQGVCIAIFVKKRSEKEGLGRTRYQDLWGTRQAKYQWLSEHELKTTRWTEVSPGPPFYFFVKRDEGRRAEYERYAPLNSIFRSNVTGIVTARDRMVIDFELEPLLERIRQLRDPSLTDQEIRDTFFAERARAKYLPGDTRGWKLSEARKRLASDAHWDDRVTDILYRPFDIRRIYYVPWMVDWPRSQVMPDMLQQHNLGVAIGRAGHVIDQRQWNIVFCTRCITEFNLFRRGGNNLYPLYVSSKSPRDSLFSNREATEAGCGCEVNVSPEFVEDLRRRVKLAFVSEATGNLKETFGPEDVFHYMYAVFHSPAYRSRYAEFLKIDFPRLPLTSKRALFRALCRLGEELTGLHLMEKHAAPITQYPVGGDNRVEKVRYTEPGQGAPTGRVWINKEQFFDNVPPDVWDFHIGGYQVCQKWLKDRKKRQLTYDDLTHYQHVVSALAETIRLMAEVDQTIEKHGGWPLG